jgi:DNA-binding response OmpR family regulator
MTEAARPLILVVEDDPDQQMLYVEFLKREGFDVETAADGKQAVSRMEHMRPAALVLDMAMAGASGLGVLNAVRENPATADLPVIVVTGVSKSDQLWQGREWGWDYYVEKPADMTKLIALLHECTGTSKVTRGTAKPGA